MQERVGAQSSWRFMMDKVFLPKNVNSTKARV